MVGEPSRSILHLDLRDVTLVGHSMGTLQVVRYLTLRDAGRVARVALVGSPPAPGPVPRPGRGIPGAPSPRTAGHETSGGSDR
ncbi:alpha/beta fold hydrolase [Streptomyces sp. NPDC001568]|uniref:alpha/beta fold hydrolase n=1 Tax=Streptomyces sp. NPDC001568 TaxID=3364588 RepID=UPI0036C811EA